MLDPVGSKFELAGVRSFEGGGVGDRNALILLFFSLKDITHSCRDTDVGVRYNCIYGIGVGPTQLGDSMNNKELKF